MSAAACVRCGAPRAAGPECPSCGVIYERAERLAERRAARVSEQQPSAAALFARDQHLAKARAELQLAKFAVPAALVASWLLVQTGIGAFVMRTFAGMWLHELGHATAAWICGYPAFPGPWLTLIASDRSLIFGLLLVAGAGSVLKRAFDTENRPLAAATIAFVVVQLFCSLALRPNTARTFITWAGDGLGMMIAVALMATFFTPPEHKLHRDWLRWGFLVIGAAGFADKFRVWWESRSDISKVPLGEYSHGDADPYKLLISGWPIQLIISRYLTVGFLALAALTVLYVLHLRRTRARLAAIEAGDPVAPFDPA